MLFGGIVWRWGCGGGAPHTKVHFLRLVQANLAEYVNEEIVDVTNPEQGCCMEVLTKAILNKIDAEETLLRNWNDHNNHLQDQKGLEEEFLVTKTVSSKEVWEDFENWIPSITAEHSTTSLSPTNRLWNKSPSKLFGIVLKAKEKRLSCASQIF